MPSSQRKQKGRTANTVRPIVLALPIFPARLQASIFGRSELNFRVRNGNGWTLALISTNLRRRKVRSTLFPALPKTPFASLLLLFLANPLALGFARRSLATLFYFLEKESKQRKLQAFSLLTVFFNSKYFIKFSSHCQEPFCSQLCRPKGGPKSQTSEAFAIWNEKINGAQVSFRRQPEANRAQFIFEW